MCHSFCLSVLKMENKCMTLITDVSEVFQINCVPISCLWKRVHCEKITDYLCLKIQLASKLRI